MILCCVWCCFMVDGRELRPLGDEHDFCCYCVLVFMWMFCELVRGEYFSKRLSLVIAGKCYFMVDDSKLGSLCALLMTRIAVTVVIAYLFSC